jgi:signal recognition particle GTPase
LKKKDEIKKQWLLQKQNQEKSAPAPSKESYLKSPPARQPLPVQKEEANTRKSSESYNPYLMENSRASSIQRSVSPTISNAKRQSSNDETERIKNELKNELREELTRELMQQSQSFNTAPRQSKQWMQMDRYYT